MVGCSILLVKPFYILFISWVKYSKLSFQMKASEKVKQGLERVLASLPN